MEFKHFSVMLDECIEGLAIKPEGIYVDGTAGGAGHSKEIAKRLATGRLIAIDRDPEAVKTARQRLEGLNAEVVLSNYDEIRSVLDSLGIESVDGILLDRVHIHWKIGGHAVRDSDIEIDQTLIAQLVKRRGDHADPVRADLNGVPGKLDGIRLTPRAHMDEDGDSIVRIGDDRFRDQLPLFQ